MLARESTAFLNLFAHKTCIAVSGEAPHCHWRPGTLHSMLLERADLQQVNQMR